MTEKQERLEKFKDLWEFPGFQDWAAGIREELAALREFPWAVGGSETPIHVNMFKACGLHPPKDTKELYEVFLATKAVVHYVERKLRFVESQSEAHYKLLKRMQEREEEDVYDDR